MKKIYTLLGAFAILFSAQSQRVQPVHEFTSPVKMASEQEVIASKVNGENQTRTFKGGDFFNEQFSNGLDGDTPFGAWTIEDSGGNTIWMMADAGSPAGYFSTTIGALNSTSADNGWVIFDCDFYNTPFNQDTNEDVNGFLTSPVIDMSEMATVLIEWEQYFRYCCYPGAPISLEVTADGGVNWVSFDAHGTFFESANEASPNPLVTSLDISCVAAGEAEVQIRFAYNNPFESGYSHYYWGIDDVNIFENPAELNLEVAQVTNGDVFNIWEYRVTPLEQAISEADGGLLVGSIYRNNGSMDQENVTITVEILNEAQDQVLNTTVSEPFTQASFANAANCPPNLTDTLYMETGWTPTELGNYWVRTTIAADGITDETPDNNTMEKMIVYSVDEYGHDDENMLDVELRPGDGDNNDFDPTGYGSFFTVPNSGTTAYGVTVRFGDNTDEDYGFLAVLYQVDLDDWLNGSFPYLTSYWITDGGWGQGAGDVQEVYLPFDGDLELEPGEVYFAGVLQEISSEGELTVMGQSNSDSDNSTGIYSQTGATVPTFVWFQSQTASPAVRLITSPRVGIDDIAEMNGIQMKQNTPNPATNNTRISYSLESSRTVSFEIYDLAGKMIERFEVGTKPSGEHTFELNTSSLAGGIYSYTMIADGVRITKKMIIAGK